MFDIKKFCFDQKLTQVEFANIISEAQPVISHMIKGSRKIRLEHIEKLRAKYGDIVDSYYTQKNAEDCVSEKGVSKIEKEMYIPMLPIDAVGGPLSGFDDSVTLDKCELVVSPIANVDFAMEVHGDSMTPDYPSGARLFVKRIDMSAFIEWGRVYVLDTCNGSVVKEVYPCGDDAIECRSKNSKFPPFTVKLKDIRGMYRVLMTMILK